MGTHPIFESDFDCLTGRALAGCLVDDLRIMDHDTSQWDIVKATQYGIFDRCKEIVEGERFDVRKPDEQNITILHWAAINNRKDLVTYYLSAGSIIDAIGGDLNSTPLHWAVRQGHQSMVALLIEKGADPSIRDGEGAAAVHLAAQFGFWPICAFLVARSGIDVDSYDTNGLTPLMWAVMRSVGPETVRVLIALGADPDLKDRKEQNTTLHLSMEKGNEYAFNTLLEKTKDLESLNKKGIAPTQLGVGKHAWMNDAIIAELEKRGQRRSRGIKRLISTHYRRLGFLYCVALIFITSVGCLFNTNSLMFSSFAIKLGVLIVLYTVMTPALHYMFYKVVNADPGQVPVDKQTQSAAIIDLFERDELDSIAICTEFMVKRPLRSKYDRFSKKLIAKFDHYCPWVNNAIGSLNHKHFVCYLMLLVLNLFWSAIAIGKYWTSPAGCNVDWAETGALMACLRCSGWVTWVFAQDVLFLVWVAMLLITQLYFVVFKGITTNEQMRAGRYSYLTVEFGSIVHNVFDRGMWNNFVDFFEIDIFAPLRVDWRRKFDYGPEFAAPRQLNENGENIV